MFGNAIVLSRLATPPRQLALALSKVSSAPTWGCPKTSSIPHQTQQHALVPARVCLWRYARPERVYERQVWVSRSRNLGGMTSRVSFRPRPLDVNKPLCVVKDLAELDSSDAIVSRDVTHNHEALDKNNEEAHMVKTDKNKKGKEIPIPQVRIVPTYDQDYLPVYERPGTYVRGKGTCSPEDEFVEYDMDTEDEEWVKNLNRGQPRLAESKFERMIWKLELACSDATEKTLRAAGASLAERRSSAAAATVEHFTHKQAIETIRNTVGGPPSMLQMLYEYWVSKRKRKQKPLLRRLQAPTQPADNNPFNVFRPREKIHRPQTRRRRENNTEALSKMGGMKQNMEAAMGVLKSIIQRERCKRNKMAAEIMIQKTELQKRLLPDSEHEMAALANQHNFEEQQSVWTRESKEWTRRQNVMYRSYRQKNHARTPVQKNPSLVDESIKKQLKRKRSCNEVVQLPPPPPILVRDEVFFCKLPDLEEVFGSNADVFDGLDVDPVGRGYPRFGRGGRLVFDRMDPLQQVPLDVHSDRNEMPPPLEAPGLLRVLIGMDKQAEGKKSQQAVPARIRGQPPAKQTPGQQRDKHTNQPGGTGGRAGPSSIQLSGVGKDVQSSRKPSSQVSNLQRRVPGRPLHRKPAKTPTSYQAHGFQVGAIVANGQSAQRS